MWLTTGKDWDALGDYVFDGFWDDFDWFMDELTAAPGSKSVELYEDAVAAVCAPLGLAVQGASNLEQWINDFEAGDYEPWFHGVDTVGPQPGWRWGEAEAA